MSKGKWNRSRKCTSKTKKSREDRNGQLLGGKPPYFWSKLNTTVLPPTSCGSASEQKMKYNFFFGSSEKIGLN